MSHAILMCPKLVSLIKNGEVHFRTWREALLYALILTGLSQKLFNKTCDMLNIAQCLQKTRILVQGFFQYAMCVSHI